MYGKIKWLTDRGGVTLEEVDVGWHCFWDRDAFYAPTLDEAIDLAFMASLKDTGLIEGVRVFFLVGKGTMVIDDEGTLWGEDPVEFYRALVSKGRSENDAERITQYVYDGEVVDG